MANRKECSVARLLVKSSFNSAIYKSLKRIHHGERAQVHKCLVLATGSFLLALHFWFDSSSSDVDMLHALRSRL